MPCMPADFLLRAPYTITRATAEAAHDPQGTVFLTGSRRREFLSRAREKKLPRNMILIALSRDSCRSYSHASGSCDSHCSRHIGLRLDESRFRNTSLNRELPSIDSIPIQMGIHPATLEVASTLHGNIRSGMFDLSTQIR